MSSSRSEGPLDVPNQGSGDLSNAKKPQESTQFIEGCLGEHIELLKRVDGSRLMISEQLNNLSKRIEDLGVLNQELERHIQQMSKIVGKGRN
ncbi:uncharacterized protein LDX57_010074 [Aspergillus melleus]|uniref:uncharacterized protein n=1 Tax=Aspergillus melleus TaxID=138277 RepID=UPI001E8DD9C0|nr:uncharacterized protein LDX57_010074 [Aspergillus melleus]KAH8432438.1 hypothetical protein LDX57_010074 [Aspergillus melleus]